MKKKILSGIFALALLITAGYGVSKSMNGDADLSVLALSNVEALANGESGDSLCDQYCMVANDWICYVKVNGIKQCEYFNYRKKIIPLVNII